MRPLSVLSLFTGGGGLDLGFERAGFRPLGFVDSDPESIKTLSLNRPDVPAFCGDIADFHPQGCVDGVIGGPPCQGFSSAGKGDPNDSRNHLWREYLRVVDATRPLFLLLENVAGMTHAKNSHHLKGLTSELERRGYWVDWKVLNAADYGVPQNRRRLILLGSLVGPISFPTPTTKRHVSCQEALSDISNSTDLPNHEPNRHAPHVVRRWLKLKEGETDPGYRRAKLISNKPAATIRAGGGYGPKGDHLAGFHPPIHFKYPRQLTVRESARLQGFPDEWVFGGSKTAQGRQVGNAVPPPLAKALAQAIDESIGHKIRSRRKGSRLNTTLFELA